MRYYRCTIFATIGNHICNGRRQIKSNANKEINAKSIIHHWNDEYDVFRLDLDDLDVQFELTKLELFTKEVDLFSEYMLRHSREERYRLR